MPFFNIYWEQRQKSQGTQSSLDPHDPEKTKASVQTSVLLQAKKRKEIVCIFFIWDFNQAFFYSQLLKFCQKSWKRIQGRTAISVILMRLWLVSYKWFKRLKEALHFLPQFHLFCVSNLKVSRFLLKLDSLF